MKGAALLLEMGLGKTKIAIDAAIIMKAYGYISRVLIIAPNSLLYTWEKEIEKHSDEQVTLLTGSILARKNLLKKLKTFFCVTNAESLYLLEKEILACDFDLVIVDEATKFKNRQAQRTKTLLKIQAPYRIIMTGTPITKNPLDVWAPFSWIAPAIVGRYWAFEDKYCVRGGYLGKQIIRFKNLDDLQQRLARVSIRYKKEDVLDLPPKMYQDVLVDLEGEQAKAYKQMKEELYAVFVDKDGRYFEVQAGSVLTQLLRLAQITSGIIPSPIPGEAEAWLPDNAKESALLDLLPDILAEENGKCIIWCTFVAEILALEKRLQEFNPVKIYGAISPTQRQAAVERFQNDPECKVFIGQSHTAGYGLTLTAARNVIYYSRDFSLEAYLQSQDRAHRIGQKGVVNIVHLIGRGTIDEHIARILQDKQNLADAVTGDKLTKEQVLEILGYAPKGRG